MKTKPPRRPPAQTMICFEALLAEKAAYVRASRKEGYRTLSPWIRRALNRSAAGTH